MHWEFTEHSGNGEENAEKWEKQPCFPLGIPGGLSIFERRFWLGFTAPRRRVLHGQGGRNPRDAAGDPGRQTQQNQGFFPAKPGIFQQNQGFSSKTATSPSHEPEAGQAELVLQGQPWKALAGEGEAVEQEDPSARG